MSENTDPETYGFSLAQSHKFLQFSPYLADAVGLNEAVVIQQMIYFFNERRNGKVVNGERWLYNTYAQWQEVFPFWSERTIQRVFTNLEQMQIVISCQPEGRMSRRKYYRFNRGMLNKIFKGTLKRRTCQVGTLDMPDGHVPITDNTSIEYSLKKTSLCEREEVVIPAEWKPTSKETQLLYIHPPADYPSQWDFDEYLAENCEHLSNKRGDLYLDLCNRKWHHWNQRNNKWTPIKDWQSYILALEEKISHSTTG